MQTTTQAIAAATTLPSSPAGMLDEKQFRGLLGGIGVTKFYAEITQRRIPRPIKIGRASRWLVADAQAYIEARAAERDLAMLAADAGLPTAPPTTLPTTLEAVVTEVLAHTRGQPSVQGILDRVRADERVREISITALRDAALHLIIQRALSLRSAAVGVSGAATHLPSEPQGAVGSAEPVSTGARRARNRASPVAPLLSRT